MSYFPGIPDDNRSVREAPRPWPVGNRHIPNSNGRILFGEAESSDLYYLLDPRTRAFRLKFVALCRLDESGEPRSVKVDMGFMPRLFFEGPPISRTKHPLADSAEGDYRINATGLYRIDGSLIADASEQHYVLAAPEATVECVVSVPENENPFYWIDVSDR